MSTPRGFRDRANDSLLTLMGEVPELVRNLVVAEINSAKAWVGRTAKHAGIGTGFFVAALFFLFWSIPVFGFFLITGAAALFGWSWWLSALIVFAVMFVIMVIFVVLGIFRMKKIGKDENPVQSASEDAKIVKEVVDEF